MNASPKSVKYCEDLCKRAKQEVPEGLENWSQSAVSDKIKALEAELNITKVAKNGSTRPEGDKGFGARVGMCYKETCEDIRRKGSDEVDDAVVLEKFMGHYRKVRRCELRAKQFDKEAAE